MTFTNLARVPISPITLLGGTDAFSAETQSCGEAIPVGGSCEVVFRYHGGSAGEFGNEQVRLRYSAVGRSGERTYESHPGLAELRLRGYTEYIPEEADLSVTQELVSTGPFAVGDSLEWHIQVSNLGPSDEPEARFSDFPIDGLSFERTDLSGCDVPFSEEPESGSTVLSDSRLTCELGRIDSGETRAFSVFTVIDGTDPEGYLPRNSVSVRGSLSDPDYSNNFASMEVGPTVKIAELQLSNRPLADEVSVHDSLTWRLELANTGPDTADEVRIVDTIPDGTWVTLLPDVCEANDSQISCVLGELEAGAVTSIDFKTEVVDEALAGSTVVNEAAATTTTLRRTESDISATAYVRISQLGSGENPVSMPGAKGDSAALAATGADPLAGWLTGAAAFAVLAGLATAFAARRRRQS